MIDNQSECTGSDYEIHSYISSDEMVSSSSDDVTPLPIITLPDDVQAYADIMKQKYQRQPIVATDWPPRVGRDFFGRLALVEKHNFVSQIETSWYMLRGEIDKIPRVYGNKNITVEDILKPRKGSESLRVVIDGPPGIGKTTLCRKLLNMWSNGEDKHYGLVLYCPLRSKKIAEAKTLSDLLLYETKKINSTTEWLEDNEGKGLLIFFDGWDELSEQHRKSSLVSSIICGDKLHHCSIIITSRSYASSSLLEKTSIVSKHIQVIGFSERQISEVIRETFGADPRDSQLVEKLIEDLKVRGDVQSLCYVPLVCSMVILVYRKEGGRLPTTLTQLYENFILQTIRRHVKRHDIDPHTLSSLSSLPPHLDNALQEMCQIAYTNLANTRMTFYINKSASEAVKEDYLGLMTTFMEFDEEMHQFLHLSIQEFLAAWWIFKYQEKTAEEVFKTHFDNDHFRMCLRFVAGLTHLEHESYQQYFNKQLYLQCKREPLFGFEDYCHQSLFLEHPAINIIIQHGAFEEIYGAKPDYHYIFDWSDPFPILLLQLLYESQNVALCQILAQSMISHSLHLTDETFLSLFDWLCLSYFINNSNSSWNEINLGELDDQKSAVFTDGLTNGLQCRRLEMALSCESVHRLLHLSNMQELYLGSKFNANILLLFKLPQLKILHIGHLFKTDKQTALELEECIAINSTLQELKIETTRDVSSVVESDGTTVASIIRGLARNKSITSFTVSLYHSGPTVPNGVIEQLLKDNNTLQALSIMMYDELLPSLLNIVEVNTPLIALEIQSSKLMTSLLPHLKGLHCLILPEPHPPHLLFDAHPSLHTLSLPLDTAKSVIELFTILQTNTTLKALKVNIKEGTELPCNFLQDYLTVNQTIQCLEVHQYKYPYYYYSLPSASDVQYNTSLRSVNIILSTSEEITSALNVLSQKENITEMYFELKTETLFDEPFLPAVTNMLQSHTTIKILKIKADLKSSDVGASITEKLQKLYETIIIHPSLEYIHMALNFGYYSVLDVIKNHKEVLLERHKREQPHRPLPIFNLSIH